MKRESRRFSRGGFEYVEYWQRYKQWVYHRKGPKAGQKWYKKNVWHKVTRELYGVWWRASASAKTKERGGQTDVDGTATHRGTKEETIDSLKGAFEYECHYSSDYWKQDKDGRWYMKLNAFRVYVHCERVSQFEVKAGKVSEEAFVTSCR